MLLKLLLKGSSSDRKEIVKYQPKIPEKNYRKLKYWIPHTGHRCLLHYRTQQVGQKVPRPPLCHLMHIMRTDIVSFQF